MLKLVKRFFMKFFPKPDFPYEFGHLDGWMSIRYAAALTSLAKSMLKHRAQIELQGVFQLIQYGLAAS